MEAVVSATLPEGAGLSSSAAVVCATLIALLRLHRRRVEASALVELALTAEREIVGVPVGDLDPRAIVECGAGGVMALDLGTGRAEQLRWPWEDIVLVASHSGEQHDVSGEGYRTRRAECARVLRALAVERSSQIDLASLPASTLTPTERSRARHLATETSRSVQAIDAISDVDATRLGRLMSASHASLAADYEVTTDTTDRMAAAARSLDGVYGARMVGAGFGGAVVALCARSSAAACAAAMSAASGRSDLPASILRPSPGLAILAPDVIGPSFRSGSVHSPR